MDLSIESQKAMDRQTYSQFQQTPRFAGQPPSLLGKIVAFAFSLGFLAIALMFSLVALAVVASVGLLFAGWFWWKTRALRKQMKAQAQAQAPAEARPGAGTTIIEGEFFREPGQNPDKLR